MGTGKNKQTKKKRTHRQFLGELTPGMATMGFEDPHGITWGCGARQGCISANILSATFISYDANNPEPAH